MSVYAAYKAAAFCAYLLSQQQQLAQAYNWTAYDSREPMAVVDTLPVAMLARQAQYRYTRYCQ